VQTGINCDIFPQSMLLTQVAFGAEDSHSRAREQSLPGEASDTQELNDMSFFSQLVKLSFPRTLSLGNPPS